MGQLVGDPGKDWSQILAIVGACVPGISSALLFSWPSPFILVLTNDKDTYDINEDQANLLPVFMPLGMMVSSIFFYKIHDVIGRKYSLLLLCVPQALFWIITIFARHIYSFYVARLICGVHDALMYAAIPIYIGEIATPKIRGTWGCGQSCAFNFGFLLINIIGSYLTIQQTAYIGLIFTILSAILFIWMPESPYYCLIKGQDDKARASLQWLLRKNDIEPDFKQLKSDVNRQISETGSWSDVCKIESNRKALGAILFLRLAQQFAGIIVFETYIQVIFDKAGSALSPQVSSIIFSALLWIVMTIFNIFSDKMGRRKSIIFSSIACSVVLATESIYFYMDEFTKSIDLSNLQWFPLVGMSVYVVVYSAGLGPLPGLMAGELFPTSIKGKALGITNVFLGLILTLSTYMFKTLVSSVGLYAPFVIYATTTFAGFILSFYLIPETKGKTLEEIQQHLKSNNKFKKKEIVAYK